MRSLLVRTTALLIQFILCATAAHLMSRLISRLIDAYIYSYRRIPIPEFFTLELQPPDAAD